MTTPKTNLPEASKNRKRNETLKNRFSNHLSNELHSDMKFHVEHDDVYIPAHRYLVGMASEVLYGLVYGTGDLPGTSDNGSAAVVVKDCTADEFKQVLRYLYTDEIQLNINNAPSMMMLAHYYDLPELEQKCAHDIVKTVSLETVCPTFERTYLLDNDMTKHCLSMIQKNTDKLFDVTKMHRNVFNLGLGALGAVMALDALNVDSEVVLFEQLLNWGRAQCRTQKLESSCAEDIRTVVKGRLELIRLSAMSNDEFGRCLRLAGPEFFTVGEIANNFINMNCGHESDPMPESGKTNKKFYNDLPLYKTPRKRFNALKQCLYCKNFQIKGQTFCCDYYYLNN